MSRFSAVLVGLLCLACGAPSAKPGAVTGPPAASTPIEPCTAASNATWPRFDAGDEGPPFSPALAADALGAMVKTALGCAPRGEVGCLKVRVEFAGDGRILRSDTCETSLPADVRTCVQAKFSAAVGQRFRGASVVAGKRVCLNGGR
ncbi:MAG: hypothetical protein IPG50_33650 [Myxococcales bacterium]|nr:hypothetical protein [Myxococcales bacterium]